MKRLRVEESGNVRYVRVSDSLAEDLVRDSMRNPTHDVHYSYAPKKDWKAWETEQMLNV